MDALKFGELSVIYALPSLRIEFISLWPLGWRKKIEVLKRRFSRGGSVVIQTL